MKFAKEKLGKIREKLSKEGKLSRFSMVFYGGMIIVAAVLIGGLIHQTLAYKNFEVVSSIEKTDNVSVGYQVMADGLLRYSKDGVSYSENLNTTVWNQTFEMASARVETCKDYLAIGDIGSNQVRIFNQRGQVGSVVTAHPIVDLAVAGQGVVAVVLSEEDQNYITLYDNKGEVLVDIRTNIEQSGYPLDIAISEDGEKVAISYLNIQEGSIGTHMVFYNFGALGQNSVDKIVGNFQYEEIFPKIEFIDNTTLAAYGEKQFILYSAAYTPEVLKQVEFSDEIKSIFISDKYLGFVFRNPTQVPEGESLPEGKYHMAVYTASGRLYMEKDFDFEYESIVSSNEEIIMYNDSECVMYTYGGKEKFRYTFSEPIIKLLPKNAGDVYILIGSSAIQEIRLK